MTTSSQRTLILLRHSKAAWPEAVPDVDRPLAPRGRGEAPLAGRWLRDNAPEINLVLRSPAVRVAQTWELVAGELGYAPASEEVFRLYAASPATLLDVVRGLPDAADCVLILGHNPDLSELAMLLTGEAVELKTSSIALMEAVGAWTEAAQGWASLKEFVTPR